MSLQTIKNSKVTIYKNAPFSINSEDMILFNSVEEQNNFFDNKLDIIYENDSHAYVKDTNYIMVKGNKNKFLESNYIRIFNGDFYIYGYILECFYINENTTNIIFEFDYFNTYQHMIDFRKISGVIEQIHTKRTDVNSDPLIIKQAQGFDVGEKEIITTLKYDFKIHWLVVVLKPSFTIGGVKGQSTIAGTYKPFSYVILPFNPDTFETYEFKYKDKIVENMLLEDAVKILTNSFNEGDNTVNNVVNIYTTKNLGIEYNYDERKNRVEILGGDFRVLTADSDTTDVPDDPVNPPDKTNSCPVFPVGTSSYTFTSPYGYRDDPITGERRWHNGLDISHTDNVNPDILAVQKGEVIENGYNENGFGNYITIKHLEGDNYTTLYAHLDSKSVNIGDIVEKGEKIGVMGTTGYSTGVHLHLEVHTTSENMSHSDNSTTIDPKPYLTECKETETDLFTGTLNMTSYLGDSPEVVELDSDTVNYILQKCKQYDILPSGVLAQLWLESNWGASAVGRNNTNWGGITWIEGGNDLSPEVTSENCRHKGSSRPSNETGNYVRYDNLKCFFKDYFVLLSGSLYNVVGKKSIAEYTKGLFKAGGAIADYAASGYQDYISTMQSVDNAIRSNNSNYDELDNLV